MKLKSDCGVKSEHEGNTVYEETAALKQNITARTGRGKNGLTEH